MILAALLQTISPAPVDPATVVAALQAATDAQQQAATAIANSCAPASVVPPVESVGGAAGSAVSCRRSDAVQPRITRAAVVMTDAGGSWSVTWASPLASTPVVLPLPVNATTEPVVCNVATRTATAATGRCWYARTLPSTITLLSNLINYDLFGANAGNIPVQVLAIPVTQ